MFQDCPKRKFLSFFRAGVDSSNSSSAIRANSVAVFNERQRAEAVDTFCVPGRLSGSHTTIVK